MKRIITYSIIALLQASVALAQTSVSLAQTSPKPKLQKRQKYEWVLDDADAWVISFTRVISALSSINLQSPLR